MKPWTRNTILGLSILGIILGGSYWLLTKQRSTNPIPIALRNNSDFATYYPAQLPDGYAIPANSYELTQGVITFTIQGNRGQTINVSQQATPPAFDFDEFHTKLLKHTRQTTTRSGAIAYLGTIESNNVASIRDATTWVLLSANTSKTSVSELEKITQQLIRE